jgi:large subunit ribosomal protein L31
MKKGIHPTYYPDAVVTCACGNTWTTGSTKKTLKTDVCYKCHPFFTGEQRIVDTAGQVERFMRRLERAAAAAAPAPGPKEKAPREKASAPAPKPEALAPAAEEKTKPAKAMAPEKSQTKPRSAKASAAEKPAA